MAITGFLEYASSTAVSGWAYDSDNPSARVELIVRVGDDICARGCANLQRNDLLAAGIGDGSHGFAIELASAQIQAETAAAVEVQAVSGGRAVTLPRTRKRSAPIIELKAHAEQSIVDQRQWPVFVLGPARSGTSALTLALLASGRYVGAGEGHLLPLALAILGTIDDYYRRPGGDYTNTLLGLVPLEEFQKLIRRSFVQLARDLYPSVYWVDKTPTVEMVRAAPLMQEFWPNARFIFMKRRVIENVLSRQRKFPHESTSAHYSDWVAVMAAWLTVRERLGGAALEVEHRQLVLDPANTAAAIAEFLGMPDPAATGFRRYLETSRPEQTDQTFGATYTFADLCLADDDAGVMKLLSDPVMAEFGYSYGESYFAARYSAPNSFRQP